MYKVTNTYRQPVFVEGVSLNVGESTTVDKLSKELNHLYDLNVVFIESIPNKTTDVITEEGSGKKHRKSSKILNE